MKHCKQFFLCLKAFFRKPCCGDPPAEVLDAILPLNNNDGSVYGFQILLPDGGRVVAVIHSHCKEDLLDYPEVGHRRYTLLRYDSAGDLAAVRKSSVGSNGEEGNS